ncbi:MAG TPA: prolyl oligopeptidase family serine peptidase [Thermoanaerobaculia bacterium]|nr:prolyl oligopeptidase family serine peptidase [Thermoanaerobaculia bacterium]
MTLKPILAALAVAAGASAAAAQAPAPTAAPASASTKARDAAVLVPSENLVVENVPAIPAALAAEVGRYTDFRSAAFWSWNPKRREMLIGTRFGNVNQVHLVKFPGGARTQMTFFPDRVSGARFDPVTGDSFIFTKDVGGNEFFQIYRYDFADGKTTLLTDGKSRNTGARWSHDGKRIAYGSTRRTGDDVDVYVMDPYDPKTDRRLLELSGGGWDVADWSADGSRLLLKEEISVNETYLWLVDVAAATKTALTPKGKDKVSYQNAAFAKDGRGLYVTTDAGSEFQRLAYMDLATKKADFLTPDTADVDDFDLSKDGKTLAYVTNEKGTSVLHLLDTASRQSRPGPKLPLGVVGGLRWHDDGGALAFTMDSARSSADAYTYEPATGKVERWTFSELGGLNPDRFSEPELVTWKSFDGREISGFLYKPDPKKFPGKRPLLIEIHGGPEGQSRPHFIGPWNYIVEELGIALLQPNVRGSLGYGKTFSQLDNGFLREGTYKDIGAGLDWIRTRPDLDADRVVVGGGSYGGHMTLAVSYLYSDRIRCSVDVVGPSNLVTFLENTSGYRRDLRRVEYGDERDPKMRAFLEKIAPMNNAEKIRKPIFVIQGGNDPRVPMSESVQIVQKIRGIGTPVWYLMAKDEGHGFAKKNNRDFQFYATILFMNQYLLGEGPAQTGAAK